MSHDWMREELYAFYDNELPPDRRFAFETHLKACGPCQEELARWRETSRLAFSPLQLAGSETFVQNVMRRIRNLGPELASRRWGMFMRWAYPALALSLTVCLLALNDALKPGSLSVETALFEGVPSAAASGYANPPSEDQLLASAINLR